jgi:Uma2 family endonuclease
MYMPTIDVPITTIEQLLALPEDRLHHELLQGEYFMTPMARVVHQQVVQALARAMDGFVLDQKTLQMFSVGADVHLGPDTLVQPDICVFRIEGACPEKWQDFPVPILAVEVLSPGTASRDRGKKKAIYQAAGVADYWIVDIDSRVIERWKPDDERPEILRDSLSWRVGPEEAVTTIEIAALFEKLPRIE